MTPDQWNMIKHFKSAEFDSPDLWGSGRLGMDYSFLIMLDLLREKCGFPFIVHSGFRTIAHNSELSGAVEDSEHTIGKGVDIGVSTGAQRFKIVKEAITMGFTRIGIAKGFVHLGVDSTKPQQVIWLY
jgi:uncharacterized protein YcbK (DUF882 family)